jgi:hypothetical protein
MGNASSARLSTHGLDRSLHSDWARGPVSVGGISGDADCSDIAALDVRVPEHG